MRTTSRGVDVADQVPPTKRQERITEHIVTHRSASIPELAELCGVSEMTIYRDVERLERRGVVRKFHGGVTAQPSGVFESNVAYRRATMTEQKAAIAARAREIVEPGMSVLLDDATTTLALAKLLGEITPLTVATNYLEAMTLLARFDGINLIALGGDYDRTHDSFTGTACVDAIDGLRVDIAFVSVSAVSGGSVYHQEQRVVAVKRAMLRAARRRVLLLDHTKLGRDALYRLAPLSEFELVIVDDDLSEGARRELDDHDTSYSLA